MSFIHKSVRFDSRRTTLIAVALSLVAGACSQKPAVSVQADKNVANSFSTLSKAELRERLSAGVGVSRLGDLSYLEIKKDALDKEFLLSASIISQRGAPTSSGRQGRVVAFSKKGKSIFLMEATDGHVVTSSLPSNLILAEIPVILETESSYILDFNAGMKNIFMSSNWYASDLEKPTYSVEEMSSTSPVRLSFLERIEIVDSENLEIRQVVQTGAADVSASFEVRYFFRPYVKNEAYTPRETQSFDRVGYFETPPVLEKETGRSVIRTTHFDISKPVKFYISANTPAEYQQAVKDGILYWNAVFGKEVIQVEVAPETVTAPDARFNMVQWVEWDQAGFAYADALMDPRSGEIKHAQVYLTSAFAWGSKVRARRLLRQADSSASSDNNAAFAQKIGMKNIPASTLCLNDSTGRMAQVANLALRSGASNETLMRLSQDYIREVVAHEVGHTLGLRHNFAGNFGANASPAVMDSRVLSLAQNVETSVSDLVPSSSVMEYQEYAETIISGEHMAHAPQPYSYDKLAIGHAYLGMPIDAINAPLFCTDSHVDGSSDEHTEDMSDCVRSDRGRNPIEGGLHETRRVISQFASAFVEAHIVALAPPRGLRSKDISEVSVEPETKASEAAKKLESALAYLDKEANSIILMRKYRYLNSLNRDGLVKDRYNLVRDEAARQGGFKKMIFGVLTDAEMGLLQADWVSIQVDEVRKFLSKPSVAEFAGTEGQVLRFSEAQKAEILAKARPYFASLQQKLLKKILALYAETTWDLEIEALGDLEEEGLTISLENGLAETIPEIVLRRGDTQVVVPVAPDKKVLFNQFSFALDVRTEASGLLGSSLMNLEGWSKAALESTKEAYETLMKEALKIESLDEIDEAIEGGNRSLQLWWDKESEVWSNLE